MFEIESLTHVGFEPTRSGLLYQNSKKNCVAPFYGPFHGSSPPPNFRGDLQILDQNNWTGPEQN